MKLIGPNLKYKGSSRGRVASGYRVVSRVDETSREDEKEFTGSNVSS